MAMTLGVSLVSMNRPEILWPTLRALLDTAPLDVPVVLVDNGSDAATRRARSEWPISRCVVLQNEANRGLSVAVNQGLARLAADARSPDLLVHMDDDALLVAPQDWIARLCAVFASSPRLGLALPNDYGEYIDHHGYRELRWGLGFCWAMRRCLYESIGGYDQHLLHQQECDLSLRVRMAGYHVGALPWWGVRHNDPGGERSELSKAREHLGVVQFRDKWCAYFRGEDWNYGTMPLYLMQHWPPDQEWLRRYAHAHGIELNPPLPGFEDQCEPGMVLGLTPETAKGIPRTLTIAGQRYLAYLDVRNDYSFWARGDGYLIDRQKAIARWKELTGEDYGRYPWSNLLRPPGAAS